MLLFRVVFVAQLLVLTSCAAYQNLTIAGIRTQRHFEGSYVVEKNLEEIQNSIFKYSSTCRYQQNISIDQQDPSTAIVTWSQAGLTDQTVISVIDFKEIGQKQTRIDSYFYYSWSSPLTERILKIINDPSQCD